MVYRVVRASSASIHHLPTAPEEAPETIAHSMPLSKRYSIALTS